MEELKVAFRSWFAYAASDQSVNDMHDPHVEQWARTLQPKISAITYRPPNTPPHVVPARIMALLLTALEAIAIHRANISLEPPYEGRREDYVRRVNDQKALIRGYLRQLKPFIFEESTPEAPQPPSDA